MKKSLILTTSLVALGSLVSCNQANNNGKPAEPVYTKPSVVYVDTYNSIIDMTKSVGDVDEQGNYCWTFYFHPTKESEREYYEASFLYSENEIFVAADYVFNETTRKSLLLNLPNPERYTATSYLLGFYDYNILNDSIFGKVNPSTFGDAEDSILLEKGEEQVTDNNMRIALIRATNFLSYTLDILNNQTVYKPEYLGFQHIV